MSQHPAPPVETTTAAVSLTPAWRRLAGTLRAALAGSELDYTEGSIGRAVVLLAVPMVLELLLESVFAVCDVFWVARLGVEAVAVVGLTEAMITPLYAVAAGLAMAATAMVARRIGEKDPRAAAAAAVQSVALGLGVAALVTPPTVLAARRLLELMGGSPEVVAAGRAYTAVAFGGSAAILLLFLINASFRGAGDAHLAMRVLWLANGVNLVLDPCLIFGWGPFPALGLTGAAVATVIGRSLGVAAQLFLLLGGRSRLRLPRDLLRLDPGVALRLLRVSVGGILQFLIATSSWVVLMRLAGLFGSAAVAGYTIAIRIIVFTILPAWGISNAAATLMGQNLGAGKPDRAASSVWVTGHANAVFLVAVAALFLAAPDPLLGLFTSDPETLAHGVACLRLVALGYGFYGYGMVMVNALNGAGDTTTPTVINLICYWALQLPLAWWLATRTTLGPRGVFLAITIAESLLAVLAIAAFRRGRWRERRI